MTNQIGLFRKFLRGPQTIDTSLPVDSPVYHYGKIPPKRKPIRPVPIDENGEIIGHYDVSRAARDMLMSRRDYVPLGRAESRWLDIIDSTFSMAEGKGKSMSPRIMFTRLAKRLRKLDEHNPELIRLAFDYLTDIADMRSELEIRPFTAPTQFDLEYAILPEDAFPVVAVEDSSVYARYGRALANGGDTAPEYEDPQVEVQEVPVQTDPLTARRRARMRGDVDVYGNPVYGPNYRRR